jgi:hypothetical protein
LPTNAGRGELRRHFHIGADATWAQTRARAASTSFGLNFLVRGHRFELLVQPVLDLFVDERGHGLRLAV